MLRRKWSFNGDFDNFDTLPPASPVLSHPSFVWPSRPGSIWKAWRLSWEDCKRCLSVSCPEHKKWPPGKTPAQNGQWVQANCPDAPFNRFTPYYPFNSAWQEPRQQPISSLHWEWLPEDPWSWEASEARRFSAYKGDWWLLSTWFCEERCQHLVCCRQYWFAGQNTFHGTVMVTQSTSHLPFQTSFSRLCY